ncbi:MAG: ParB/RepB/Spo0J family partition protein [Syntrophomonadaceae bacterium]
MAKKERGLGRGLEALLPTSDVDSAPVLALELNRMVPQLNQPRKNFDDGALRELVESIREHGILQPILVRPKGDHYEIIAGERRWRAAQLAGLESLPALIREIDDLQAAEISLVENLQREDLSAIEEAQAFKNLVEYYRYTQEQVAARVGKSRAYIANTIRLLNLSPEIIEMIEQKKISPGHARALLSLRTSREQIAAAYEIINGKLSVREAERKTKKKGAMKKGSRKSAEMIEIEERLQRLLGTRVEINADRRGGKIEISYYDDEDLERLIDIIGT